MGQDWIRDPGRNVSPRVRARVLPAGEGEVTSVLARSTAPSPTQGAVAGTEGAIGGGDPGLPSGFWVGWPGAGAPPPRLRLHETEGAAGCWL